MQRTVSSRLELDVTADATVVLCVAVAPLPGLDVQETLDTAGAESVTRLQGRQGGVQHVLRLPVGQYSIRYDATVTGTAQPPAAADLETRLEYALPSRYCESDRLGGPAADLFGGLSGDQLLRAVRNWVNERLSYVLGASRVTDGAVETFLARDGVCRDYAHLTIAMLRAREIPARLVACYAPGLDPMDYHAVAEAWVDDRWQIVDSTGLAPRQSMLRICTGRDAVDTSFMTTFDGAVTLTGIQVGAVVDGQLPMDDQVSSVQMV